MLNNEFEKQVESAMLLIAQEQIPDTPHRFPPDFEARLIQQTADTGIEQTHMKTAQPQPIREHKSRSADFVSRLLTWGSLAAGVMAAVTVGAVMLHEQRDELTAPKNQEEPAIQELLPESEPVSTVSDTTTSAACTTVSASMTSTAITQTTVATLLTNPVEFAAVLAAVPSAEQTSIETTMSQTVSVLSESAASTETTAAAPDIVRSNALLEKYSSKFHVIEQSVSADSQRLQNESYMADKVYTDGILYSAFKTGDNMEYDWTEYVECIVDDTTDPPRLVRQYHNCEYENGFYYSVHEDSATVHGADTAFFAEAETIAIPETLGGFPVREIAPHAFDGFEGAIFPHLSEIVIPDCVSVICNHAFSGVFTQERIRSLPDRIRECKINIPKSVQYIGDTAYGFGTVRALGGSVTLPETLEYIDERAFYDQSAEIELFTESQIPFEMPDAVSGSAPYLLTDEGYVPLSTDFYPEIVLPESTYVCNADYLIMQRCFVKKCRNALCPKQYAEYYIRENLSNPQGDVNLDGMVNHADAVWLQRYLLGSIEPFLQSQSDWKAGDCNQDGILNAADLTLLKRMLLHDNP